MSTLLVKNITTLATPKRVDDAAVFVRDGWIEEVGRTANLPDSADEVVDLTFVDEIDPHPHLAQLLFLSAELVAMHCGAAGDQTSMLESTQSLVDLVTKMQRPGLPLNEFFRRYLTAARDGLITTGADSRSAEELLERLNRLLGA